MPPVLSVAMVQKAGAETTPVEPVALDPEGFGRFVSEHELVLIEVWAEWCGPCEAMAPAIEELAATEGVAVGTVDHDEYPGLMADHRSLLGKVFRSLPAIFVFRDGEVVERTVGGKSLGDLRALVEPYR